MSKSLIFQFRFWSTKASFTGNVNINVFRTVSYWVQCNPKILFTHNVKMIKGTSHKTGDVDGNFAKQELCPFVLAHVH